jgi:hypothetical protein
MLSNDLEGHSRRPQHALRPACLVGIAGFEPAALLVSVSSIRRRYEMETDPRSGRPGVPIAKHASQSQAEDMVLQFVAGDTYGRGDRGRCLPVGAKGTENLGEQLRGLAWDAFWFGTPVAQSR